MAVVLYIYRVPYLTYIVLYIIVLYYLLQYINEMENKFNNKNTTTTYPEHECEKKLKKLKKVGTL